MEKQNEHLDQLTEIRNIMDKSTRFISLSGLSGVVAGFAALIGAWFAYRYFGYNYYYADMATYIFRQDGVIEADTLKFLLLNGTCVLAVAIGFGSIFTFRKAKKKGQSVWDRSGRRMLLNLMIPLAAGGIFTLILLYHGLVFLVPSATLIFYGLALLNASRYTLEDIRYLGLTEIALGLIAAFYIGYGLLFWTIGFGLLHIVYGIIMYIKHDKR
ncbi:MAG: hypothetical protein AB8B56_13485 [Crocinitomicaceae bacterium]